jgi:hypothetical protein
VVATAIWRGMGVLDDQRETVFPPEDVGLLSGVDRSYSPKLLAALTMEAVPATFEQLLHILEAGVKTATPATDTGGSGKIYTYDFPTTAQNTIKTYTLEGGDNQQEEEAEYCFVEKFTLAGKGGEAVTMAADWKGRQVVPSTFTNSLVVPTVEEILFSKGKLYSDAVSGTAGTTQISNTLLDMSLEINTGWVPVFTAEGALYFSFAKSVAPEIVLALTYEHDANAVAAKADWRAQTPRLLQLTFQGSALTTAGSAYTYKTLKLLLAGKWEKFDALGEQDGNDVVKGTFRARYDATAAKYCTITVVNELASVP